jgi:hypothetical protein
MTCGLHEIRRDFSTKAAPDELNFADCCGCQHGCSFPMACKYFRSWPPSDIGDPARLLYIEPSLAEGASGIDNGRGEVAHFSAGGYDPLLALPLGHGERIEPLQASFAPSEPGRTRPRREAAGPDAHRAFLSRDGCQHPIARRRRSPSAKARLRAGQMPSAAGGAWCPLRRPTRSRTAAPHRTAGRGTPLQRAFDRVSVHPGGCHSDR